jgi:hypothetical protein
LQNRYHTLLSPVSMRGIVVVVSKTILFTVSSSGYCIL